METKEKKAAHSPLPWKAEIRPSFNERSGVGGIFDADGKEIVVTDGGFYPPTEADARLIVRAVNNHEELVTLLERLEHADFFADSGRLLREDARALLAKIKP